jgi:hypothetical protein
MEFLIRVEILFLSLIIFSPFFFSFFKTFSSHFQQPLTLRLYTDQMHRKRNEAISNTATRRQGRKEKIPHFFVRIKDAVQRGTRSFRVCNNGDLDTNTT